MVSGAPHTAFHYVAYSQLLRNLSEITRDPTLILHHRSAANHFQIFELGQIGEQFFLNAIGKVSVLFFFTQIVQRKNGNTFVGSRAG